MFVTFSLVSMLSELFEFSVCPRLCFLRFQSFLYVLMFYVRSELSMSAAFSAFSGASEFPAFAEFSELSTFYTFSMRSAFSVCFTFSVRSELSARFTVSAFSVVSVRAMFYELHAFS